MMTYKEYSIKNWIKAHAETDLTFDKFHLKEVVESDRGKFVILNENILDKYHDELIKLRRFYTWGVEEEEAYAFNPKALSYKLYGTVELWSMLLHLNEMRSASEFTAKDGIYVYSDSIKNFINEIINIENESILANQKETIDELIS